jgi:hypothetical protein
MVSPDIFFVVVERSADSAGLFTPVADHAFTKSGLCLQGDLRDDPKVASGARR